MTGHPQVATVLTVLGLASALAVPFDLRAAERLLVLRDPLVGADSPYLFAGQVSEPAERAAGNQRIHEAHLVRGRVSNHAAAYQTI